MNELNRERSNCKTEFELASKVNGMDDIYTVLF